MNLLQTYMDKTNNLAAPALPGTKYYSAGKTLLNIQNKSSADDVQQAMYTARKVDPLGPMSQNSHLYANNESKNKRGDSRWRIAGNKEPFDLYRLIEDFGKWYDMVLDNKGHHLTIRMSSALPRFFHGDRLMLGFLLWDIASYSQTYLGTGDVLLEIDSELVRDNWYLICFSLSVPGFGISQKKKTNLFFPISRQKRGFANNASSNLYYAGIIAGLLGGAIHVENSIGHGVEYITEIRLQNRPD